MPKVDNEGTVTLGRSDAFAGAGIERRAHKVEWPASRIGRVEGTLPVSSLLRCRACVEAPCALPRWPLVGGCTG